MLNFHVETGQKLTYCRQNLQYLHLFAVEAYVASSSRQQKAFLLSERSAIHIFGYAKYMLWTVGVRLSRGSLCYVAVLHCHTEVELILGAEENVQHKPLFIYSLLPTRSGTRSWAKQLIKHGTSE